MHETAPSGYRHRFSAAAMKSKNSRFYIAELVQEFRIRGAKTSLVWVNIHLIKARSADEAHSKALRKGREHNQRYRAGKEGRSARWIFRGLRDLLPLHEGIGDGAEILFEEYERAAPSAAKKMVRPRKSLTAFRIKTD